MNIYEKINKIRLEFSESEIKKSGKNAFANSSYLELSDFIPTVLKLNDKYGVYSHIDIRDDEAVLKAINVEKPQDFVTFKLKVPSINEYTVSDDGVNIPIPFNQKIQSMGARETYIRRYMYLLYLEIAVDDEIDNKNNKRNVKKSKPFVKPKRV